jgi:hypothetical protein
MATRSRRGAVCCMELEPYDFRDLTALVHDIAARAALEDDTASG